MNMTVLIFAKSYLLNNIFNLNPLNNQNKIQIDLQIYLISYFSSKNMEIKSPVQFNLEGSFFSGISQSMPRGAFTDINYKSQSSYSLFSTPKIFHKESSQFNLSCKTLLRFDENNLFAKETQSSDVFQASAGSEKGFFARAQVSRYKNNYIPFSSGKKIPEESMNKENSESEAGTPKEDSNKSSKQLNKGISYPVPRNLLQTLSQNSNSLSKTGNNPRQPNPTPNFGSSRSLFGSENEKVSNSNNLGPKTPEIKQDSSPFSKGLGRQESFDSRKLKKEAQLSPRSKSYFDDIERKRKDLNSKASSTELLNFYMGLLPEVPARYQWKIFLELAEAFKKDCNYNYAKSFYKIAVHLQPYNSDVT
jgi:hypothetical protein